MAAGDIVPVPGAQFEETLASASPDVLRAMIREFAQRMMDADVEVACNAGSGKVSPERVNSATGTGAGSGTPGPGRAAARDPGLIPLTVHEVKRLLAAALSQPGPPGHAARWLEWRRRHQARSRWFHQRARLARNYPPVS